MSRSACLPILCLVLLSAAAATAANAERAFWVWNRPDPLTPAEQNELRSAGVSRLYWQAGEVELHGGELVLRRTAALTPVAPGLEIVPVVRVATSIRSPEQFSGEALGRALQPVADAAPGRAVQIDFDCPDRLLPIYAERLRTARAVANIHRLTVTALAGWAGAATSAALWPAVDAVFPMLYDTEKDPAPPPQGSPAAPGAPSPCQPRRLLDEAALAARLRSWHDCPIPWYAGLPVFARVTLYDAAGHSRGHLRSWDWEDLVFDAALILDRAPAGGTTVLRAARATGIAQSPVPPGGFAAIRQAELPALRASLAEADAAGAQGVVFFRLPDSPKPAGTTGGGWSLPQLLTLLAPPVPAAPSLRLRRAPDGSDRWVLRNDSATDLPPCFGSPGRGYGLEMELSGGTNGWREALPGDFHHVTGHVFKAAGEPVAIAIPLARRLTFWFAELPAGGTLTTGLVQLAPGFDPSALRFRLPLVDQPEATPWQTPD